MALRSISRNALLGGRLIGWDWARFGTVVRNLPRFVRDLRSYSSARSSDDPFPLRAGQLLPMLTDFDEQAGDARGQYFYQDLWAAQKIFERRPSRHLDVGSRMDGFVAHLLTFMEVDVVDIRPYESSIPRLKFVQADGTNLSTIPSASIGSLSSLHAVEHFGLGRYGDPIVPDGWRMAMRSLARVLAPGGTLYFSVPVGRQRLQFNAQRIFDPETILSTFHDLALVSFSAIDDDGAFLTNVQPTDFKASRLSCGLFEFAKPPQR